VKRIDMWAIDMVFVVGGNGGNAGAAAIQAECAKSGVTCSVIGIPKSIDNDILLVISAPSTMLATCLDQFSSAVAGDICMSVTTLRLNLGQQELRSPVDAFAVGQLVGDHRADRQVLRL